MAGMIPSSGPQWVWLTVDMEEGQQGGQKEKRRTASLQTHIITLINMGIFGGYEIFAS